MSTWSDVICMRAWGIVGVGVMLAMLTTGCATAVPGAPSPSPVAVTSIAPPTTTTAPSASADKAVCIEFDARGGALYSLFVIPMMKGKSGEKSVSVDVAQLAQATASLTDLDATSLANASGDIQDQGQRLVAAAQAIGLYNHAEGTALLTSFVSLGVACQKAGYKPSWFDAAALTSS